MNSQPLVTVMIPTYNQEEYIRRAINSVLEQTYDYIEVIISDDSPNRGTEEIVKEYLDCGRVKYVHNHIPKGRVGNYRFMLYEMANGDWVVNLDGDDYFDDRDFIKKAVSIIKSDPDIVMIVAQQKRLYEGTNSYFIPEKKHKEEFVICSGEKIFLDAVFKNIEIPHLATIYNRRKSIETGFYELDILSSDRVSLLKLTLKGKVALLNRCAGVWVHHANNVSQKIDSQAFFSNLYLYDYLFDHAKRLKKFPYGPLLLWKILGKYKSIYGNVIKLLENDSYDEFISFIKRTTLQYPLYAFLLFIDMRIYKKFITEKI